MEQQYQPPERARNFVAYAKEARRQGNAETGEATDFRTSVWVREYASILVAEFNPKTITNRYGDYKIANVMFDAKSAGIDNLNNNFGGTVEEGNPVYGLLQRAHAENKPVSVALETVRKVKDSDGNPIDPTTYIHDLRGAERNGTSGNANITGKHCRNIVVGAGPAGHPDRWSFSSELASDPAEWPSLAQNRSGDLPPAGWRTHEGGIIPVQAPAGGGAEVDMQALAAMVADHLRPIVDGGDARPRPAQRDAHATEAKPWERWNSDGRANLGSYHATSHRARFCEAVELLSGAERAASDVSDDDAWELADLLTTMASTVQARAYGDDAKPQPGARSHCEAARWITFVATTYSDYAYPASGKDADVTAWASQVTSRAVSLLAAAGRRVGADDSPAPQQTQEAESVPDPEPEPAPEPEAGGRHAAKADATPQMKVTDSPGLLSRWEGLLTAAGQSERPERFQPLFTTTFGVWQLSDIEAEAFAAALDRWENDISAFIQAGFQAWEVANPQSNGANA